MECVQHTVGCNEQKVVFTTFGQFAKVLAELSHPSMGLCAWAAPLAVSGRVCWEWSRRLCTASRSVLLGTVHFAATNTISPWQDL